MVTLEGGRLRAGDVVTDVKPAINGGSLLHEAVDEGMDATVFALKLGSTPSTLKV